MVLRFVRRLTILCLSVSFLAVLLVGACAQEGEDRGARARPQFELLKLPQTPPEYWRAARFMYKVGQLGQAKRYLQQFLQSNPDDELLVRLVESPDFSILHEMRHSPELGDLAAELLKRAEAAVRRRATDPERIRKMIGYLSRGAAYREYALRQLRAAGADAVPHLIAHLRALTDGRERSDVVAVMRRLDRRAVPPLIAALESNDPRLVRDVGLILSRIGDRRALTILRYFAESPDVPPGNRAYLRGAIETALRRSYTALPSAVDELVELGRDYYAGAIELPKEPDGTVRIWRWVPREGLQSRSVSPEYARVFLANRAARFALRLDPTRVDAAALVVATLLRAAPQIDGNGELNWSDPDAAAAIWAAAEAGPNVLASVLDLAIQQRDRQLALRTLRVVRELVTVQHVAPTAELGRSLTGAAYSADPRVRFAAVEAILSTRAARRLGRGTEAVRLLASYLIPTKAEKEVAMLVVDPARASDLAVLFEGHGVQVRVFYSLSECLDYLYSHVGLSGLVVVLPVPGAEPSMLVSALRNDARTRGLPVLLLTEVNTTARWQHIERRYASVAVRVLPANESIAARYVEWLTSQQEALSSDEQTRYAERAIGWLQSIARGEIPGCSVEPALPVLIDALHDERLAAGAAAVLAYVGRPEVQVELLRVALNEAAPESSRVAAARAARESVRRFGLLVEAAGAGLDRVAANSDGSTALGRELRLLGATIAQGSRGSWDRLRDAEPAPFRASQQ